MFFCLDFARWSSRSPRDGKLHALAGAKGGRERFGRQQGLGWVIGCGWTGRGGQQYAWGPATVSGVQCEGSRRREMRSYFDRRKSQKTGPGMAAHVQGLSWCCSSPRLGYWTGSPRARLCGNARAAPRERPSSVHQRRQKRLLFRFSGSVSPAVHDLVAACGRVCTYGLREGLWGVWGGHGADGGRRPASYGRARPPEVSGEPLSPKEQQKGLCEAAAPLSTAGPRAYRGTCHPKRAAVPPGGYMGRPRCRIISCVNRVGPLGRAWAIFGRNSPRGD